MINKIKESNSKIKYLAIVFLLIGVVLVFIGVKKIIDVKKVKSEGSSLADKTISKEDDLLKRNIDFVSLKERNEDVAAWITVPNTNINQPIFQERKMGEYFYLSHDIDKKYDEAGSLFFPKAEIEENKGYTIVFGHQMQKSIYGDYMFTMLKEFYENKKEAVDKYSRLYVYKEDIVEEYVVFAAKEARSDDDIYVYPKTVGTKDYEAMLDNIEKTSLWTYGSKPNKSQISLILSTCDGFEDANKRFFVVYRLNRTYDKKTKKIVNYDK